VNPKTRLKNKANSLWKQIILSRCSSCEVCGSTEVLQAHHFYFRSSCPHLAHNLTNGVVLCNRCHAKLHFRDAKLVETDIIRIKGKKWFNKLEKQSKEKWANFQTMDYYRAIIKNLESKL